MDQSCAMDKIFRDPRFSSKYKIAPYFFRTTYHALRFRFEIEVSKLFDQKSKSFQVNGDSIKITPIEYKILELLMSNVGRVYSAEAIYESVWGERCISTDTVMVHVRRIREKIEIDPKNPRYLKVVWGIGYKIDEN